MKCHWCKKATGVKKIRLSNCLFDDPKTHAFSPNCGSWEGAEEHCWWCGKAADQHKGQPE